MIACPLIAHRGCAALAPENTLAAMTLTHALGMDWVEIDVTLLGDGTAVIFHDNTLDRLTHQTGLLADLSQKDLSDIDIGSHFSSDYMQERMPTLAQMLTHLNALGLGLNLEIKSYPNYSANEIVQAVIPELLAHWQDFDRLIISSFDTEILKAVHNEQPEWQLGQLWEGLPEDWLQTVNEINAVSVHLYHAPLTKEQAQSIKAQGLDLYVYTVNRGDLAKSLYEMDVDGLFTDNPHLIDTFRIDI